jgi:hypothetical protein
MADAAAGPVPDKHPATNPRKANYALATRVAPDKAIPHNTFRLSAPIDEQEYDAVALLSSYADVLGPDFNLAPYSEGNQGYPLVHLGLKDGSRIAAHPNMRKLLDDGISYKDATYGVVALGNSVIRTNMVEYKLTRLLVPDFMNDADAKLWLQKAFDDYDTMHAGAGKVDVEVIYLTQKMLSHPSSGQQWPSGCAEMLVQHSPNSENRIKLLPAKLKLPFFRPGEDKPWFIETAASAAPGDYKIQHCVFCKHTTHERPDCRYAPACRFCGKNDHAHFFCPDKPNAGTSVRKAKKKKTVPGGVKPAAGATARTTQESTDKNDASQQSAVSNDARESREVSEEERNFSIVPPRRFRSASQGSAGQGSVSPNADLSSSERRKSISDGILSPNRFSPLLKNTADSSADAAEEKEAEEVDQLASTAATDELITADKEASSSSPIDVQEKKKEVKAVEASKAGPGKVPVKPTATAAAAAAASRKAALAKAAVSTVALRRTATPAVKSSSAIAASGTKAAVSTLTTTRSRAPTSQQ